MRRAWWLAVLLLLLAASSPARVIVFDGNRGQGGITLERETDSFVEVEYRLELVNIEDIDVHGEIMQQVSIPGVFLPNDEGAPNVPRIGRFVAMPNGATAHLEVLSARTEVVENINLLPAPRIPFETDTSPPEYNKDMSIYAMDAYYPEEPIALSERRLLRGVESVILGITPFQYNPVTQELLIYTDVRVRVNFEGGTGYFGEDRLRSRYWEPILRQHLVNYRSLPGIDFNQPRARDDEYDYVIICPDDPTYTAWADSIAGFRTLQGIDTGVFTLTQTGATYTEIESWVNNAYSTWDPAPSAVLLLGDYVSNGGTTGVTSPTWSSYCVSDNIYADYDGDDLPDIAFARITATPTTIEEMVTKGLNYERSPVTDPGFYDNPVSAAGWQSDRWFVICADIIYGFWEHALGKNPVREYAGTSGPPGSWSTNSNTWMLIDYFGPGGLGYIPSTPAHLTDWGANATRINNDVNAGAFILQHRDHGGETGWGSPSYHISDLSGLHNDELTFVFSINCLTGKYNWGSECFTEAFHRMHYGALGLVAASEVSYSFVNDTFVFGMYDGMWPQFMPDYPLSDQTIGSADLRPGFAHASGKHFLESSNWPVNPNNKVHTHHLFHMHGDAFTTLYSEVPEVLTVAHDSALLVGSSSFVVTADAGSVIALTIGGEIIGVADGTGSPVAVPIIPPQTPGEMRVTVTKANYYRYSADVQVIPPDGPYCVFESYVIDDDNSGASSGNGDGKVDAGEKIELVLYLENVGSEDAYEVFAKITQESPYALLTDFTEYFGDMPAGHVVGCEEDYDIMFLPTCPDGYTVNFGLQATDMIDTWDSYFSIRVGAPVLSVYDFIVDDSPGGGNGNGCPEGGETVTLSVTLENTGSSDADGVVAVLSTADPYATIIDGTSAVASVPSGGTGQLAPDFKLVFMPDVPPQYELVLDLDLTTDMNVVSQAQISLIVGGDLDDDFESGVGGWTHYAITSGFTDQWHMETYRYHSTNHSWKFGGSGSGAYANSSDGGLVSPPVCIGTEGHMTFWDWLYAEEEDPTWAWDCALVEISTDGGESWEVLMPVGGYSHLKNNNLANPVPEGTPCWSGYHDWREEEFDLSEYEGSMAYFRFRFASDGYVTEEGWYIDDVVMTSTSTGVEHLELLPATFALLQNTPNPFNPVTTLTYHVPHESRVTIDVYNVAGRLVRTLLDGSVEPGVRSVVWDGTNEAGEKVASGVYLYRMSAEGFTDRKMMVLLK